MNLHKKCPREIKVSISLNLIKLNKDMFNFQWK